MRKIYPDGIHAVIAKHPSDEADIEIKIATFDMPSLGHYDSPEKVEK